MAEGGRTGFTSVVTGVLFLLAILLTPLAGLVPVVATGPVLVVVGYLMVQPDQGHRLRRHRGGLAGAAGLILMPLTFSITVGIGAAFVAHVVIKVVRGQDRARSTRCSGSSPSPSSSTSCQDWINSILPK